MSVIDSGIAHEVHAARRLRERHALIITADQLHALAAEFRSPYRMLRRFRFVCRPRPALSVWQVNLEFLTGRPFWVVAVIVDGSGKIMTFYPDPANLTVREAAKRQIEFRGRQGRKRSRQGMKGKRPRAECESDVL